MPPKENILSEPMVSIRDIKAAFGILVTEDLLASLGFEPAGRIQNARLYAKAKVPDMALALAAKLTKVAEALKHG